MVPASRAGGPVDWVIGTPAGQNRAVSPSIAFVLGAGGVVGAAWLAGSIDAIADATGYDARAADLLVGTSAGASVAATLRQGFSPADHVAQMLGEPLSPEGRKLAGSERHRPVELPEPPSLTLTGWRPQAPHLALAGMARLRDRRPGIALSGLVPAGSVPHRLVGDPIRSRQAEPWPTAPTWLCAVCLTDGRFVVLGRDETPETDLATAVEASVAIPGYFAPVDINGRLYVDGGARSVTSADLVAGLGFDLVVVIAPMTAVPSALRPPTRHLGRAYHSRVLAREVHTVRQAGSPVLVLQPTAADLGELGPSRASQSAPPAVRAARRSTLARLALPDAAEAVDILRSARRWGPSAVASAL